MATANFPSNPVLNQTYANLDRSWTWNGQYWQATSTTVGYSGSVGYTGSASTVAGYTGSAGTNADLSTTSINALSDVDTVTTTPTNGQALLWNGTNWIPGSVSGGGGGGGGGGTTVTVSDTAPGSPSAGNLWFNSSVGQLLLYYSGAWVQPSAPEGSSSITSGVGGSGLGVVTVAETAPTSGNLGDLWYKSSASALYVRYNNDWESVNDTESVSASSSSTVYSYDITKYRTAKLICQALSDTTVEACELLLTYNGTTVYLTEYGNITSSGSDPLVVYDASIAGGYVNLTVSKPDGYLISVAASLLL